MNYTIICGRRIIVEYVNPPIPVREFDFCAVCLDYEPGDPQGYGPTRQAAIENLKEKLEDAK